MTPASAKSGQYHYYRCYCKNRILEPAIETTVLEKLQNVDFLDDVK